jgi:transposase
MGAPYPQVVRDKIFLAADRGKSAVEIADMFSVSESWVRRLLQRRRLLGEVERRAMGGKRFQKIDREKLAQLIADKPDATLHELRAQLGVACAISAIGAAVHKLGLSFKKRRSLRRSRTVRTLPSDAPSGSSGVRASTRAG